MAHSLDFIITPVITNLRLLNQITIDITERNEKLVLLRPRGDGTSWIFRQVNGVLEKRPARTAAGSASAQSSPLHMHFEGAV